MNDLLNTIHTPVTDGAGHKWVGFHLYKVHKKKKTNTWASSDKS